jgi:hypothetical protein
MAGTAVLLRAAGDAANAEAQARQALASISAERILAAHATFRRNSKPDARASR